MKGLSLCDDMLRAFAEGRKTCFRELMNPQPDYISVAGLPFLETKPYPTQIKPRYLPGEVVYIKEAWMSATPDSGESFGILYRATLSKPWTDVEWQKSFKPDERAIKYFTGKDTWRSPSFMPEWAARYHARITDVRPERIQEITPEDCEREGITGKTLASPVRGLPYEEYENGDGLVYTEPLIAFHALWDRLHPGSWGKNDWVFRYGIERVEV